MFTQHHFRGNRLASHRRHARGHHFENLEGRVHLSGSVGCGCAMCNAAAAAAQQLSAFDASAVVMYPLSISRTAERSARDVWQPLSEIPAQQQGQTSYLQAQSHSLFSINTDLLQQQLWSAPREFTTTGRTNPLVLSLPRPDGTTERFAVQESSVMAPELQAKFPDIRTFIAQGIDNPAANARLDLTPQGFHAQVLTPDEGAWYIDPYIHTGGRDGAYLSYYKKDLAGGAQIKCQTIDVGPVANVENTGGQGGNATEATSGTVLRQYDFAVATTGEYTAFHGGTVPLGLAAVTTVVNRMTQIYETDLTVRLTLVANNNLLIYTNAATDPFTNPSNPSTTNSQNQSNTDAVIGSANYDVGHVFHRGSDNGLAGGIGTVGRVGIKAQGYSSKLSPTGDPFTVDYVAHEVGHQFGGRHTFSNCGGGPGDSGSIAVEPGSGSTIMAYAGICGGTNLQANSDAMMHSINADQIQLYLSAGAGFTSATNIPTGNTIPVVNAGPDYNIPANTFFSLTATATDADGDILSYSWEQRDGFGSIPLNTDSGVGPIIRARVPSFSPTRFFPRLPNLLAGTFPTGEILPTTTRLLSFTVMVRDNRAGGGGVQTDDMFINVTNTGAAFAMTNLNTFTTLTGGAMQTITWNVAGTNLSPINTANVEIAMSTDGGSTFPIILAGSTPNDGSADVQLPFDTGSSSVRIRVKAVDNIYFDVNNVNLAITNVPGSAIPTTPDLDPGNDTGISNSDNITNRNNSSPGSTLTFTVGNTVPGATVRVLADGVEIGTAIAAGSTTVVTTNGSTVIPDGTRLITARQTPVGQPESGASLSLSLQVDTVAPQLSGTPTFTYLSVPHTLQFAFTEDLSATLNVGVLDVFNAYTGANLANANKNVVNGAGNSATLTFPGLNNGATGAIEDGTFTLTFNGAGLTDVAGNAIANPAFNFFFLNGDANRDKSVAIADFSVLAANFNASPRAWFDGDFNYSGGVEIGDFSILASKYNLSVPAEPARIGSSPAPVAPTGSVFGASRIDSTVERIDLLDQSGAI